MGSDSNGNAVKDALTADMRQPQGPPWLTVDSGLLLQELQGQLAAQATEMAAMRVYIGQLHQALQSVGMIAQPGLPQENPAPTP